MGYSSVLTAQSIESKIHTLHGHAHVDVDVQTPNDWIERGRASKRTNEQEKVLQ